MNLILLNSIQQPTKASLFNKKKCKNLNVDKLKTRLQDIEKRKLDNLKQSFTFIKNIGEKDLAYFKSMHDTMVEEFNNTGKEDVAIVLSNNEGVSSGSNVNKEDIFDN